MDDSRVLDSSIIKDLSNHIYEKRKATAFQIENYTKSALATNDSRTIYKIIRELTELTYDGTNSAEMGAITALGSVSVALGSFAIAYFLEEIIKPILATFRDTDARVRYYACESLYNIAKIARGEILLYFNEVFDVLCILVTDTESSVKNAADILDRLIKDIVSAKSTNYVSIIQQEPTPDIEGHFIDHKGVGIQVNNPQDVQKAFSLPKFIPTLLERMYTIDPFAKKFLISWIELFDDIPSLELITFLPNFLEQLIKFLMNNSPSDVRIETKNLLNVFLKEIKSIAKVKFDLKKKTILQEQRQKEADKIREKLSPNDALPEMKDLSIKDEDKPDDASVASDSTTIVRKRDNDEVHLPKADGSVEESDVIENGQNIYVDYPRIISILLSFLRSKEERSDQKRVDLLGESHEIVLEIQMIVIKWLQEMLEISPTSFVKYLPDSISVLTTNLAIADENKDFELRNQLMKLNSSLQKFLISLNESGSLKNDIQEVNQNVIKGLNREAYDEFIELYLSQTLRVLMKECNDSSVELSRMTILDWLIFLYSRYPENFFTSEKGETFDFISLLKSSANANHDVILRVLMLLSKISEGNDAFFKDFILKLIQLFRTEFYDLKQSWGFSKTKIEFVVRKLCESLDSEKIYRAISEVLIGVDDLKFLNAMIVTLNTILLTTPELAGFRKKLKALDYHRLDDWSLFAALFQSWCNNAPSVLSLCLITSNYELAYLVIKKLSELEVDFQLLTELDILVQLLESPIFLKLRLQLLEPERHPNLYKALYGLLMILPQSSTFKSLKERLASVSYIHNINAVTDNMGNIPQSISNAVTPGQAAVSSPSLGSQLSLKRKRNYEMLELYVRAQDLQESARNLKLKQDINGSDSVPRTPKVTPRRDYFSSSLLSHDNSSKEFASKRNVTSRLA